MDLAEKKLQVLKTRAHSKRKTKFRLKKFQIILLKKAVVRHALRKIKAEFTFVNEHLIFLKTKQYASA